MYLMFPIDIVFVLIRFKVHMQKYVWYAHVLIFFFISFFLDTVVREIIVFLSLEDFCFDGLEKTCSEFLGENL